MHQTERSERIDRADNDPRYTEITKIAETLMFVAGTETTHVKHPGDRISTIIAALNAALMMSICNGMKSEHMRPAFEEMVETMRLNIEMALKSRGYQGP